MSKIYQVVGLYDASCGEDSIMDASPIVKSFATKEEALAYSKGLAERQNGTLRVHASKGKSKGKIQKQ